MEQMRRIETGFVAFFDILGYRSFLRSGISDVTFKVIDLLAKIPEIVKREQESHVGAAAPENIHQVLNQVVPLVISDSILLRASYTGEPDQKPLQAMAFLVTASVIQRLMFESGLPLRGAIAFGEFIFTGHVFAGVPVLDAHELENRLGLAACVAHQTAVDELKALQATAPEWNYWDGHHLVHYRTRLKGAGAESDESLLNLAWPTLEGYTPLKARRDLAKNVHEMFIEHGKVMEPGAATKAQNTVDFLRYLQDRFPYLFDRDP
jgi:hypothetical protein